MLSLQYETDVMVAKMVAGPVQPSELALHVGCMPSESTVMNLAMRLLVVDVGQQW